MKKIISLITLTLLMSGCLSTVNRPVSQQEVKHKDQEAFQTTKAYLIQETKTYQRKLRVKLDQVGERLRTLGEKAKKQTGTLREKTQADLQQWTRQHHKVQAEFNRLSQSTENNTQTNLKILETKIDTLWKNMTINHTKNKGDNTPSGKN